MIPDDHRGRQITMEFLRMTSKYITVEQLAERWSVSQAHIRRLYLNGSLKTLRLGRVVRIPLKEIERLEKKAVAQSMGVVG